MKKLFTLSIVIFCAFAINAQITWPGIGFLEAFEYEDGTEYADSLYSGLAVEWPEGSSVLDGALTWDQDVDGEGAFGLVFDPPLDVTGNEDFIMKYQLPQGTEMVIYVADGDGGEGEIIPTLFLGLGELMSVTIDLEDVEGLDPSKKITEVWLLPFTPTAGTLFLDDITLGDVSTVGISNTIIENTLNVYPNPTSGEFRIDKDVEEVSIYNIAGKVVYSEKKYKKGSSIDVSELKNGLYIIEVDKKRQKLIIR